MDRGQLVPHLFRTEYSKITAVLCKRFGFAHVETAEDIASEAFLAALETWSYNGIPDNPVAWLYTVASNKAKNRVARDQNFSQKIAEQLRADRGGEFDVLDLSESNIVDSQLKMMFALCNPLISDESQIGLALRILCGFGIDEIANAFLSSKETINKRLFRAREKLRNERVELEFPTEDKIAPRLENVMRTLYLLFNEGYYSETNDAVVREDLCHEAMRLTAILLQEPRTSQPKVHALFALMCFHSSRLRARKNALGGIVLYDEQDESLWDRELISKGAWHLHESSQGNELSKYHLEASIAYWHTVKSDTDEKWESILKLYDHLIAIELSSVTQLNRIVAVSKVKGAREGIRQLHFLNLENNPFYFALLGELYIGVDKEMAKANFEKAMMFAKTATDRDAMEKRLRQISDTRVNSLLS